MEEAVRIIEEPGRVMAQKQLRRFPQEHHPFSLLTLIQSPKLPGLLRREEGAKVELGNSETKETSSSSSNREEEEEEVRLMNRQQQLVRREPESAAFLLGEQQQQQSSFSSRAAHCQTVAADLSLHSSTSSYPGPPPSSASYPTTSAASSFPPTSEPPPLFYPLLPARTPLTHNLAGYDFYQQQGGPEFASEGLPPPAPQPFSDYQEYYDRLLLLLYF